MSILVIKILLSEYDMHISNKKNKRKGQRDGEKVKNGKKKKH